MKSNLYPNDGLTHLGGFEVTDWVENLTWTDDVAASYYLGYIPYEEYPKSILGITYPEISEDNSTIYFREVAENHPWGYCWQDDTGTMSGFNKQLYAHNDDDTVYKYSSSSSAKTKLFNKLTVANVNQCDGIRFQVVAFAIPTESISGGTGFVQEYFSGVGGGSITFPLHELSNFLNGTTVIPLTLTIDEVEYSHDFSINDYTDNDYVGKTIIGDYTVFIYISSTNLFLGKPANISYDYGGGNYAATGMSLVPFVRTHLNTGMGFKEQDAMLTLGAQATDTRIAFDDYARETIEGWSSNGKFKSAGMFHVPIDSLSASIFPKWHSNYYGIINGILPISTASSGGGTVFLHCPVRPIDIYRVACLTNRVQIEDYMQVDLTARYGSRSTAYTNADNVCLFTDENIPKWEFIIGSSTTLLSVLQDWQKPGADITENEFDEDEMPPYDPEPGPSPVDTEGKFTGDNPAISATRVFTTKGVQYYAINETELSAFINLLWSQPKSFYEALQIAGKQVDSIFDYIESLRYYPVNVDFDTSTKQAVRMGTGAVLMDATGTAPVEYYTAVSDPWSWNIGSWNLSDSKYHWRGNFLDYAPYTKISLYAPYVGTIELDPASIASNSTINSASIYLDATIDISTGCLTYYVRNGGGTLLATKTVKLAIDLPLNGNNATAQSAAILRAQFNTTKQVLGSTLAPISSALSGNAMGTIGSLASLPSTIGSAYLENSLAKKQIPVEVQSQGGVASNIYDYQRPFLTVHRQKVSNPDNYGHTTGFLVDGTFTIQYLSGFTVCRNVDVGSIGQAVDKEKAQIKKILESGFYA